MLAALLSWLSRCQCQENVWYPQNLHEPQFSLQDTLSHRSQPSPGSKELTLEGSREGASSLQGPAVGQALHNTVFVTSSGSSSVIMSNNHGASDPLDRWGN